jgi:hypothetical protein
MVICLSLFKHKVNSITYYYNSDYVLSCRLQFFMEHEFFCHEFSMFEHAHIIFSFIMVCIHIITWGGTQ